MRALLLAAGLGTRLRPITNTVPKCLVEINGKPLLDHWLDLLCHSCINNILVNLHYMADRVQSHLAECTHSAQVNAVMENKLLGTAGTLLRNRKYFRQQPVMLIHADNLSVFDVSAFIERFQKREEHIEITMMTFYTDSPQDCGIVELNEKGHVCGFHEKVSSPPSNLANAAVYILAPSVVDFIGGLGLDVIDFSTEVLPHYIGRINTFHNDIYHRDIGTPESLALARNEYSTAIRKKWADLHNRRY